MANVGGLEGCTPSKDTSFSGAAAPAQTHPLRKVSCHNKESTMLPQARIAFA
jgi:hypothetical protein